MTLALVALVLFGGGVLLERILLQMKWKPYFQAGFPLFPELVPLPRLPTPESGATATVRWEREGGFVRFWVDAGARSGPAGLHGSVVLWHGPGGVHLGLRWSPPWTPLMAGAWLIGLGMARGERIAIPIGLAIIAGILWVYRSFAIRAAAELRWHWVSGEPDSR